MTEHLRPTCYNEFVEEVKSLLPNESYHNTSLLGVSFHDESDIANGNCIPVAQVKIVRGGFYATLFGETLISGVSEEEAFQTLIDKLESMVDSDPYPEFTRGGNP